MNTPRSTRAVLTAVLAVVLASPLLTLAPPAKAATQTSVTKHGYFTAPDGASLNYTVVLPSAGKVPGGVGV
jgi:hypothetical protein